MTDKHTARLYTAAASLLVLFAAWVAVATHPWKAAATASPNDPRLVALHQREVLLRHDIALVQKLTARATAARSTAQLASARQAAAPAPAAAPSVRIVHLPPLVVTRTS
jgi:hypothetical protein